MKNEAAQALGKIGGKAKSDSKTKAARANARKRYTTTVRYRAHGEQNLTIKNGAVTFNKKITMDTEKESFFVNDAIIEDIGVEVFEEQVTGLKLESPIITLRTAGE